MKKFVIETKSELKGKVDEEKRKPSIVSKVLDIVIVVFLCCSIAFSGFVLFLKLRYVSCFVSGMSMFPTLNSTGVNSKGELFKPDGYGESTEEGDIVDYCLTDCTKKFRNKINRFDIVCSFYPNDVTSEGEIKPHSYEKIKRVIGLPGETLWIENSYNEGSKYMGSLYVCKDTSLSYQEALLGPAYVKTLGKIVEKIDQPIQDDVYDEACKKAFNDETVKYHQGNPINYKSYSYSMWQLAENSDDSYGEYVLLGDNRANSSDSRMVGKIDGSLLTGRVIVCIGKGEITENGESCKYKVSTFTWRSLTWAS